MKLCVLTLLLGAFLVIDGEKRSLKYIYTALSVPSKTGIPQFTAMGLLDHRQIDYFDNKDQTKLPRKPWMLSELGQEYFDKGTQSRRNKMQWFKVNLDILMKRLQQNATDLHVLQWQHGCEVDQLPDGTIGTVGFLRGVDSYSYDGEDFLAYDSKQDNWVSTMDAAAPTKTKWNKVNELISYTDGYLKSECMSWLLKFVNFEAKQPRDKPELHIFSKKSLVAKNHVLTCLATGLQSKSVHLEVRRDGRVLDKTHGLKTVGLSPNQDETFQQRYYVELLRSDTATYTCHVPKLNLQKTWDGTLPPEDSNSGIIAGAVGGGIVLIIVVAGALVCYKRKRRGNKSSDSSADAHGSENGSSSGASTKLLDNGGSGSSAQSIDSGAAFSTGSQTSSDSNKSDSGNESPDIGANAHGSENGSSSGGSTPPSEAQPLIGNH